MNEDRKSLALKLLEFLPNHRRLRGVLVVAGACPRLSDICGDVAVAVDVAVLVVAVDDKVTSDEEGTGAGPVGCARSEELGHLVWDHRACAAHHHRRRRQQRAPRLALLLRGLLARDLAACPALVLLDWRAVFCDCPRVYWRRHWWCLMRNHRCCCCAAGKARRLGEVGPPPCLLLLVYQAMQR